MASEEPKLELYHALPNRSTRVVHLIEELRELGVEVPVAIKDIKLDPEYLKSDEYKAINPCCTIPAMTNHKDLFINESNAILLFVLKEYGKGLLQPRSDDAAGWATFFNWMFRSETALAEPLSRWLAHAQSLPDDMRKPDIAEEALAQAMRNFQVLEDALEGKDWLVNNTFSAADVATSYSAGFLVAMGFTKDGKFPNIKAYNDRVMLRPAEQRVWAGFEMPEHMK